MLQFEAWMATEPDGTTFIYFGKPEREENIWLGNLIGVVPSNLHIRRPKWEDKPIEVKVSSFGFIDIEEI